jgi:AraC family transcriptional regulator, activator of mtrCDE
MNCQPMWRISRSDLEGLLDVLAVNSVKLTGCVVTSLSPLTVSPADMPSIYYNLEGAGRMMVGDHPPIELQPHTLVIVPRGQPVRIKASANRHAQPFSLGGVSQEVAADEGEAQLNLIWGHFSAAFGWSVDLFEGLATSIVEQFDAADQLDYQMKSALDELNAQEVGTVAMATAFLKQVLVTLLRRSLNSNNVWVERLSILHDPQIGHAFAEMVARPGAPHCVTSLSQKVGLSRSVFMARFAAAFGCAPMAVLRQLRMRHAAGMLTSSHLSIDQVSHGVGYASRSSFFRAFRKTYGSDPSDYRAARRSQRKMAFAGSHGGIEREGGLI